MSAPRFAIAVLCATAGWAATAQPVLDAQARRARDSERLAGVEASAQVNAALTDAHAQDLDAKRQRLARTLAERDELGAAAADLRQRTRNLSDDLDQAYAVVRTALSVVAFRVDGGPLALDHGSLAERARALRRAEANIDNLYQSWFVVHEAWLASGQIAHAQGPVTGHDGRRQSVALTRLGEVALVQTDAHGRRLPVVADPQAGLVLAPEAATQIDGALGFGRRLLEDSGAVGVGIVCCALLGLLTLVRAAGGRRETSGDMKLVQDAALLLGLLGTVVGLIQTFRSLAQSSGGDVTTAATGIAHALATTALGLLVTITLMLLYPAVRRAPDTAATVTWTRPQTARRFVRRRLPVAALAAVALTFGMFFVMQWLTQRSQGTAPPPQPAAPVAFEPRSQTPPPPPPMRAQAPPAPTHSARVAAQTPSAVAAPAFDTPSLRLPALEVTAQLLGATARTPVAAGQAWTGSARGEAFAGKDLVPISSARPRYPAAALAAGLDGFVDVIFEIDPDGRVRNVRILDADPAGVFEQAAADAVARWLYAPFRRNGQPLTREATQRLVFDHRSGAATWQDSTP